MLEISQVPTTLTLQEKMQISYMALVWYVSDMDDQVGLHRDKLQLIEMVIVLPCTIHVIGYGFMVLSCYS
jgi:hypothetical protein